MASRSHESPAETSPALLPTRLPLTPPAQPRAIPQCAKTHSPQGLGTCCPLDLEEPPHLGIHKDHHFQVSAQMSPSLTEGLKWFPSPPVISSLDPADFPPSTRYLLPACPVY